MSRKSYNRQDRLFRVIVSVLLVSCAVLVAAIALQSKWNERHSDAQAVVNATAVPLVVTPNADVLQTALPDETGEPEETPRPNLLTGTQVGMPVYSQSESNEKRIAIALDDCTNLTQLRAAIDAAVENGAKLTLFPYGNRVTGAELSALVRESILEHGFEVENRGWDTQKIYALDTLDMAKQIWGSQVAVEYALGKDYAMHLLMPSGGQGTTDPRTCAYLQQLGYDGFVTWSYVAASANVDSLRLGLKPGLIYLFSCTESDVQKLSMFLQFVAEREYEVVTVSELLGFAPVEVSEPQVDLMSQPMPIPEEYELVAMEFARGDRAWQVKLIQQRLAELGYMLSTEADGALGDGTVQAIMNFQAECGLPCTGIANVETQNLLFAEDAPTAPIRVTPTPAPTPTPQPENTTAE
ncbi:MAG: peptidoglycan-binding protein [Clostridia bacterium]|nr:peptidoglycan-binding protein [Clostridia bacterium]